jgi:hypothetical protein
MLTERDRHRLVRIVPKICSTGDSRTEYSSWRSCFYKNYSPWASQVATSMVGLLLNLWLLKVMLRCVNDCVNHKTWTADNWKRVQDMVRWVILHADPYIRKSLCLENTHGSQQSGMPSSNSETRGRLYHDLGSSIVVQYSVGPIITFHGRISAREYMVRTGNQVHPMIQTLFPNDSFPRRQCPHSHSWNCSVMVWRAWRWTSASSLANTLTRF